MSQAHTIVYSDDDHKTHVVATVPASAVVISYPVDNQKSRLASLSNLEYGYLLGLSICAFKTKARKIGFRFSRLNGDNWAIRDYIRPQERQINVERLEAHALTVVKAIRNLAIPANERTRAEIIFEFATIGGGLLHHTPGWMPDYKYIVGGRIYQGKEDKKNEEKDKKNEINPEVLSWPDFRPVYLSNERMGRLRPYTVAEPIHVQPGDYSPTGHEIMNVLERAYRRIIDSGNKFPAHKCG